MDIASYSALACIAIQANQNDQHGGQSIVDFDYGMAPGVKKTFIKRYRANLARALELLCNLDNAEETAEKLMDLMQATGAQPTLEEQAEHREALKAQLLEIVPTRPCATACWTLPRKRPRRRRTGPPIRPWKR